MNRDDLTEEEARRRMAAQPTNSEYIQQANVIFSTQWEPEYTQKQVWIIVINMDEIMEPFHQRIMYEDTIHIGSVKIVPYTYIFFCILLEKYYAINGNRIYMCNLSILVTRSELASLAHSFISVPHIIMHMQSTTFTYIFVRMSRKQASAHAHPA